MVDSRQRWNYVARLQAGVTYEIRADSGQTWFDAGIECGPDGYTGRGIQRLLGWTRRLRRAPWFALVGKVGNGRAFEIGTGRTISAAEGGELRCYANDTPGFRFNNRGRIEVSVTRATDPRP
jgi:hypothetical protein